MGSHRDLCSVLFARPPVLGLCFLVSVYTYLHAGGPRDLNALPL